jgi:hypothetical protein
VSLLDGLPLRRPIDGVDQSGFFQGAATKSAREGTSSFVPTACRL